MISFGGIEWEAIACEQGCTLLLACEPVCLRAFHDRKRCPEWNKSAIRAYLNGAFLVCLATVFSTFWLPGSDNLAKEPPMSQISAFPSIKALSILLLVPLNSTSLPWWTTLSIIAEASLSSPRIVPHLLNSMLVVNTTLRFS